jgi:DNA-binding CsgD family transcriptional regulator
MWKIFLIGSLFSMAVLALDGILNLKVGSLLFGVAHSLGYISIYFLIGGSAQMTGCLRMFRWFCVVVFFLSFILDPMIANIFAGLNDKNNIVALMLMVIVVSITFSRYSILYKRVFETDWIRNLNIIKRKPQIAKTDEINKETDKAEGLGLTPREKQLFTLMLTDMSVKEIMIELEISKGTFNFHSANLYRKLEIQSRTELLVKFSK